LGAARRPQARQAQATAEDFLLPRRRGLLLAPWGSRSGHQLHLQLLLAHCHPSKRLPPTRSVALASALLAGSRPTRSQAPQLLPPRPGSAAGQVVSKHLSLAALPAEAAASSSEVDALHLVAKLHLLSQVSPPRLAHKHLVASP